MFQREMRKRISEHSQRVIQNNECERRLLDGRIILMNKEHVRQLRNHDIEMLQLKHEIKMFNETKREISNETNEGGKFRNRPSTVEMIRLKPNKMTRSKTFAHGTVDGEAKTQRYSVFPQLEDRNTQHNSKCDQTAPEGDTTKDEVTRQRSNTNDEQVMFRKGRRNSYLDKSSGMSSGQHLPELPKHLQRYDHRSRPKDESRMDGTFKTKGASATQLSMVHSIAWLSFRERQNVMNTIYSPDNDDDDDDDDDDEVDQKKTEQNDKIQSLNDASKKVEGKSKLMSASDSTLHSSRFHTGMIQEDDEDNIPLYRSQYLSYYSLNRPTFPDSEVKKTENDLMNMMTRSKIKFGQGRHIASRIERRRLLRSWNARSLPTSQNTDEE